MKRLIFIGIAGIALVAVLVVGLALGVMVSPVSAQIGQSINLALHGRPALAVQTLAGLPQAQVQGPQLKDENGVLVGGVFTDSPADKAGIARGDILLQVDGKDINTNADLKTILAGHKVGDALNLTVKHGDAQKSVSVTLAEQPAVSTTTQNNTPSNNGQTPQKSTRQAVPYLGIVPIGAGEYRGMGGFFGPGGKLQKGAASGLIVQVATGSPAEKAGLKVGEKITAVDGQAIDAQHTLSSLISGHKPGDSVKLSVTAADGSTRDVTVALGDNPQKAGSAYLGVSTGGRHGDFFMMPGMPGNPNNGGSQNGVPSRPQLNPGLVGHPGALVQQVTQNSPAEKGGLKAGQLIVSVDGKAVNTPQVLTDSISGHKVGDQVTLSVFDPQTSKTNDVKVTLGDNPQKAGSAWLGISYSYIDMQQRTPNNNNNNGGTQF